MSLVAYMAHPLGEKVDNVFDNNRSDNLSNGLDWVKFLKATTHWAICYPTFVYVASDDRSFSSPRSLIDQLAILWRCDFYVMVGGSISPHMREELRHARSRNPPMPILDLTSLGRFAPWDNKDSVGKEIERLAEEAGIEVW